MRKFNKMRESGIADRRWKRLFKLGGVAALIIAILLAGDHYAAVMTDEERAIFLATGQTMIILFNEKAFLVTYVIVSASWAMISSVMLRSNVFGQMTVYAGIFAGLAGIVAVILEHIAEFSGMDTLLEITIFLYFGAIVFLFIWVVLAGRRLLQICTIRPEIDTG